MVGRQRIYNQPFDEDKRLLRVFAEPGDLQSHYQVKQSGEDVDFFNYYEAQLLEKMKWSNRYEGIIVYIICETDEDINRSRQLVESNQSERVVIGVPNKPIPIREAVMNLRAAFHIRETEDLDSMTLQDRTRLQDDLIGDERQEFRFHRAFHPITSSVLGCYRSNLVWEIGFCPRCSA